MAKRRGSTCVLDRQSCRCPNTSPPKIEPAELRTLAGDYAEIVVTFGTEYTKLVAIGKVVRVTEHEVHLVDAHWNGDTQRRALGEETSRETSRNMYLPVRWVVRYSEFWK